MEPVVTTPTSPKVLLSTVGTFLVSLLLAVVGALMADPSTLSGLGMPPVLLALLVAVLPAVATFLTGYLTPDKLRVVGQAALNAPDVAVSESGARVAALFPGDGIQITSDTQGLVFSNNRITGTTPASTNTYQGEHAVEPGAGLDDTGQANVGGLLGAIVLGVVIVLAVLYVVGR